MRGTTWVVASALAFALGCGRFDFASQPDAAQRDAPAVTVDAADAAPDSYAGLVLASGPRMYYRASEAGGSTAFDASGNGLDAVYSTDGTIALLKPGATTDGDTAVFLDADGNLGPRTQAEVVVDAGNLAWDGDFTIELFVHPLATPPPGNDYSIFLCESYLIDGFRFAWSEENVLQFWTDQAGGTTNLQATTVVDMTRFNHVALVHEGTSFVAYQDGVEVLRVASAGYIPATPDSDCGFGSFHGMATNGVFDELAIYDRALTQAELAAHLAGR